MERDMTEFTEKDAASAYARMWNRQDCSEFVTLITNNCHYASEWVLDEMTGKKAISEYLTTKIATVKKSSSPVRAELGQTLLGVYGRDCAFLIQGNGDIVQAVVIFEINGEKISRVDLCMPEIYSPIRSGVYPI